MTERESADEERTPHRTPRQRPTIDEVFEGYEGGDYEPPADYPCRGAEIDWGERVGAERPP